MSECNDTKSDAAQFAAMVDILRGIAERNRALLPEGSAKLDVVTTYLGGLSVSLLDRKAAHSIGEDIM